MQFSFGYLKRFLAGAIFGLYMAHLLYILNPQIEINPSRLVEVTLLYALTGGLVFGTALWLMRLLQIRLFGRDVNSERRHGFGLVVTAAFVSAVVFLTHLLVFRIYLPASAVKLLKIDTNLIVLTAFALLVVWMFERSADRRVSRALVLLGFGLIAVSSFFLYQRRDRYQPEPRPFEVANIGTIAGRRPVILVVLCNVPHDWIVTLVGEGALPWFDARIHDSFFTRIEAFPTSSAKALWASLATGQLPSRHGVTGRFSYRTLLNPPGERYLLVPNGIGFAAWGLFPPVQRISAQLPSGDSLALWQMFGKLGLRVLLEGWPATSPARPVASVVLSNRFFDRRSSKFETFPAGIGPQLENFRVDPVEIDRTAVQAFSELGARRSRAFANAEASDEFAGRVAGALHSGFDLTAMWLSGFADAATASGTFGNALPRRDSNLGLAFRRYLAATDDLLDRVQKQSPNATLVVVSCSGPHPPTLPGNLVTMVQAIDENQDPGADDGFLLMSGKGIAHRENPPSGNVVDVVPTILFSAALPVARDMDGRVITEAFDDPFLRDNGLSLIQSYEARQLIVRRTTE